MFELKKVDGVSKARLGRLCTSRGEVETPAFMAVGTQGTVKALDPQELEGMGTQIILGNTYHLSIRPGVEIIRQAGGLHRFMAWKGPILTDSGGYQVFSLAKIRKILDDGVEFRSHLDGALHFIGPDEAMALQCDLGSDIAMVFDDCPPHTASRDGVAAAVRRTLRWARRCREQPRLDGQAVFGIVQGGIEADLREECARRLIELEFDGYAIGGVSVGEPEAQMMRAVELTEPHLPRDKARYAMGLGTPAQIVELVARGIDMFDCVLPTRVARNGTAFTRQGTLNIKAGSQKADFGPIEEGCGCHCCRHFSRAYIRHLLKAEEILGLRLMSIHNTFAYMQLMRDIREHLGRGTFDEFRREFRRHYVPTRRVLEQRTGSSEAAESIGEGRVIPGN